MSSCCKTCDHRQHDIQTTSSIRELIDVCLITLHFRAPISPSQATSYAVLQNMLNDITDAAESTTHPTTFTTWSPCISNPHTAIILTTASETCENTTSPIFDSIMKHLACPPIVQHIYHDYSIVSFAASSPEQRIDCDIISVQATSPGVASAIGKSFGWDPKRSSLSSQVGVAASAACSRPGDLTRDFYAWAELHESAPLSPASSFGSGYESSETRGPLISTNSVEKNMSLAFPEEEDDDEKVADDETLVMIFQWSSRADADRFKHPLQKSFGQNGQEVSADLWDRHVAHPVRQLQGVGARIHTFKLALRGVGPRMEERAAARERSGSHRFSTMASGFGEKVGAEEGGGTVLLERWIPPLEETEITTPMVVNGVAAPTSY